VHGATGGKQVEPPAVRAGDARGLEVGAFERRQLRGAF
jgi:hypothetical protein